MEPKVIEARPHRERKPRELREQRGTSRIDDSSLPVRPRESCAMSRFLAYVPLSGLAEQKHGPERRRYWWSPPDPHEEAAQTDQSSTLKPGTRPKSRRLRVTTTA